MDDAGKDLRWVIFFLLVLAIVWYFTGGPNRITSTSGLFLNMPQQQHSQELQKEMGQIFSGSGKGTGGSSEESADSIYKNIVSLAVGYAARQTNLQEAYVEIRASSQNTKPVDITSWSLIGKIGLDIKIGQGAYLPYSAQVNLQQDIFLNKGEKAVIIVGESPIGTSFRLNKCTGYFSQFQAFYPDLPKECPRPSAENSAAGLDDQCLDYLDRLPTCQMQISVPPGLSQSCQNYINENINYSKCVELHKNDSDFYKPEWRVYLGRKDRLWSMERETIILKDQNGKTIDWGSY
jgi:hypothetical protein